MYYAARPIRRKGAKRAPVKGIYLWWEEEKTTKNSKTPKSLKKNRRRGRHAKPGTVYNMMSKMNVSYADARKSSKKDREIFKRNNRIASKNKVKISNNTVENWTRKPFESSFAKSVHYDSLEKQTANNLSFGGTRNDISRSNTPNTEWLKMIQEQRKNREDGINVFEK